MLTADFVGQDNGMNDNFFLPLSRRSAKGGTQIPGAQGREETKTLDTNTYYLRPRDLRPRDTSKKEKEKKIPPGGQADPFSVLFCHTG